MHTLIKALIGLGLYCLSGVPVLAVDYVIAVIDPSSIVEQSPQYEAARAQLKKEVSSREQRLEEQQEQLTDLQQKLERDKDLMGEEEIQRLQTDIRNRERKIKYAQAEFREDVSLRQNELRTKLAKQVEEVVAELAHEENIDLILSENLVYFSKRLDISDKVVQRLREKFEADGDHL